jgi:hypothetical protein
MIEKNIGLIIMTVLKMVIITHMAAEAIIL